MSIERVEALVLQMTEEERFQLWGRLKRHGLALDYEVAVPSLSPEQALQWAEDYEGTDKLRSIASRDGYEAFFYAKIVDRGPHEETRRAVCRDLHESWAYDYAREIDKGPHDETRQRASEGRREALHYALNVDKGPHEVTRKGTCKDAFSASRYATLVDKCYHPDTWAAVRGTDREEEYRLVVGVPEGVS